MSMIRSTSSGKAFGHMLFFLVLNKELDGLIISTPKNNVKDIRIVLICPASKLYKSPNRYSILDAACDEKSRISWTENSSKQCILCNRNYDSKNTEFSMESVPALSLLFS